MPPMLVATQDVALLNLKHTPSTTEDTFLQTGAPSVFRQALLMVNHGVP